MYIHKRYCNIHGLHTRLHPRNFSIQNIAAYTMYTRTYFTYTKKTCTQFFKPWLCLNYFYYKSSGKMIWDIENDKFLNSGTIHNEVTRPVVRYGSLKVHRVLVSNCLKIRPISSTIGVSVNLSYSVNYRNMLQINDVFSTYFIILSLPVRSSNCVLATYKAPGHRMFVYQCSIGWNFW